MPEDWKKTSEKWQTNREIYNAFNIHYKQNRITFLAIVVYSIYMKFVKRRKSVELNDATFKDTKNI